MIQILRFKSVFINSMFNILVSVLLEILHLLSIIIFECEGILISEEIFNYLN